MNFNQIMVIALAILLMWWPIGGLINRRRGQAWLEWLQLGLKELGATSTVMWLRSFKSVGQGNIVPVHPGNICSPGVFHSDIEGFRQTEILWIGDHFDSGVLQLGEKPGRLIG